MFSDRCFTHLFIAQHPLASPSSDSLVDITRMTMNPRVDFSFAISDWGYISVRKVLPSTLFYVLMWTSFRTGKKGKKKTEANGSINWACCMSVKEFCRAGTTNGEGKYPSLRFIRWRLWKIYENCWHWMETSGWIHTVWQMEMVFLSLALTRHECFSHS